MKRFLLRADDLGYSDGVNCGIAAAVEAGLIRTVGIMTNMPLAASGLVRLKADGLCLGQHTNICTGRPLTDPARIPSIVEGDGHFKTSSAYRDAAGRGEDFVVLDEVLLEIEAQYRRFLELVGREPEYFEGHAVASPTFFRGLEIVAERHHLPYFAMGAPGEPVWFRSTRVISYIPEDFSAYEKDPYAFLKLAVASADEDSCRLMVFHPGYIDAYLEDHSSMTEARIREADMLTDSAVAEWLTEQDVELVTYADLP
ncbi:MAG TPA: ChbG/HpnK family deacetylase [Collinsella ihuae]|uniref:ChbG/HpnK family deacetylase n=1 Tax=Collinsella ihumii TaxID=1720204 RepID=A0A921LTK1_9ACTN|nr:ChbG/HpnK family deacetylase [Collinsella ihumii]